MSYRITTDSTADLPQEFLNERGIAYVGLAFQIGGEEYREGPDLKMTSKEFYDQLRAGTPASTVQVNTYEFIDFAEPFLAAGEDVDVYKRQLVACVFPFIPFDILKIALATAVGYPVRHRLARRGLL